jgi:hypothetical protein
MKNPTANSITVDGQEIPYYRIDNDVNGNPRYVIHFLDLGVELKDYGNIRGLTKYRAKWFGGGYVIQSYSLHDELKGYLLPLVRNFYKN